MNAPNLPQGTVTFVFTDIEGSTRLLTALGARYPELLSRHHATLRKYIAASRGLEVKTEGDAFFIVFDRPSDALGFAVATQRALGMTDWPTDADVRVRMGLHTGEGTLSEGDYVGIDVHRAARVAAAGHGGQILVSGSSAALLADVAMTGVRLRDLGEHRLKDLPEPLRIFDVEIDGLPSDFPPIRSIGKGSLPEEISSFVGRESEVERISALLGDARLVTLTGPGGTGKTRLSIEVARNIQDAFTDGAWFVPLEEITDPDLVPPAIARVMGVKEDPARPQIDTLTEALSQRRALIVLDNFEQVVGAARHVNRLLRDAPSPRVLCSSREALRISGEQEFPVPPLEDEPAIRLFVQRALQLRPDFAPNDEDLVTIAAICRAVDRLPLAIELAAARIRMFPLATLLARLSDRLGTLESSRRDLSERQRTLRGAIEWSYDLLDEVERDVFARLAVFAGGADLAAVEAIVDPRGEVTADVLEVLAQLVEKSLVVSVSGPGGEPRYRMLETIHSFAREKLASSRAVTEVRDRHLDYFVTFAESIEPQLTSAKADLPFARTEADHDNLRAAMTWSIEKGAPAGGFRIGGAIWRFWQHRGRLREGRELLERALTLDSTHDPGSRARGLTGYGSVVYWQGDYVLAQRVYEEALALYREAGDQPHEALALFDLGFTMSVNREMAAATETLEQAEALYASLGDERGRLAVAEGRAAIALINRDLEQARSIAELTVEDYRRLDMRYRMVDTLGMLIGIYLELGELSLAQKAWTTWTSAWREIGDYSALALVYEFSARMAFEDGRPADAARLLGALQQMRDRGDPFLVPSAVMGIHEAEPDVRATLSAEQFDEAFEEGRAWPRDQAIDMAIKLGAARSGA
ncbi:MAG TPA: adenylate/guanylate cyclase domain-containing protein [Candidatus Limnocylindrales bacterium]